MAKGGASRTEYGPAACERQKRGENLRKTGFQITPPSIR